MKKRIFFFSAMLLYASLSFGQFSGSGSGTESDPYKVTNAIQLSQLSNFLGQSNVVFQLQNDIDLTDWIVENNPSQGWSPIGVSSLPFKGILLGGGHTVSGLLINRTSEVNTGFFGCLSGARISNFKIEIKSVIGGTYVGGLAGYASRSTFTECEVLNYSGTMSSSDNNNIGGIIGLSEGNNSFTSCRFRGMLSGNSRIGGIVATIHSGSPSFVSCSVEGNITGTGNYIGGLVGECTGITIESMNDCYFDGSIEGVSYVGGLIGAMTATDMETPALHYYAVYEGKGNYNPRNVSTSFVQSYSETINDGTIDEKKINNCAVKGNVVGQNNVGGLVGAQNSGISYSYKSHSVYRTAYFSDYYYTYAYKEDGVWVSSELRDVYFSYNTYYKNTLTLSLSNCSFAGSVIGAENVGGLIGYKSGGSLQKNCVIARIEGVSKVGGIVGMLSKGDNDRTTTVQSNVAINDLVSATQANAGRIYGVADENYTTIGAIGSSIGNRSLAITKLVENGKEKIVIDDFQNGSSLGAAMLKMKDNYVAWGWNFDTDWNIQNEESYPYKVFQAAPPTIDSELTYRATEIYGRSADGGRVYLSYNDNETLVAVCEGIVWAGTVSPLRSGTVVTAYVTVDGKMSSYTIKAVVPDAAYVILDEDSPYAPEASNKAENILVKRTIKANEWSTICLPFTATGEQVKQAWGEDVQLASFTGWESEEDADGAIVAINVMFSSANVNEGIAANTPMLIKVSRATETATFDGVSIEPEEAPVVQVGRKASERGYFYGTYTMTTVPEENLFLSGNKFWYSTGATSIKGYRGYFELRDVLDAYYDGSEVKANVFIDDEATGIRTLSDSPKGEDTYNLAGQRVGRNYKGVVVTKGKKILY